MTNEGKNDDNLLNILLNDNYQNLKLTSIRSEFHESNIKITENQYPEWFSKNKLETHLYKGNRKNKKTNDTEIYCSISKK